MEITRVFKKSLILSLLITTFFTLELFKQICCTELIEINQVNEKLKSNVIEDNEEVHIGLILDMKSREGKIVKSCISVAIYDFYTQHKKYNTRLVLHSRDSNGEPLHALSAALELLDEIKVKAIIGGQTLMEAKFIADFGDKVNVPVISLSNIPSSSPILKEDKYPFLVQAAQDETLQFKGMASIVKAFKWTEVILIYEDILESENYDNYIIQNMITSFQQNNIEIAYKSVMSAYFTDKQLHDELHKLLAFQTTVFIIHMSSNDLLSRILINSKKLGIMSKGYAWFMTATTMKHLHNEDYTPELIKAMEGVVGLKSYIPASKDVDKFTSKLTRAIYNENHKIMELKELGASGIWAYDSIWALAEAVERTRFKLSLSNRPINVNFNNLLDFDRLKSFSSNFGHLLVKEILGRRFKGLSGEVQFDQNGKAEFNTLEIVNLVGKAERQVGILTFPKENPNSGTSSTSTRRHLPSNNEIDTIIWPGTTTTIPKGRFLNGTTRVINLRIAIPRKRAFKELVRIESVDNNATITATGFCVEVFKAAIDLLPYHVEYQFLPFPPFDQFTENYSDIIHQVYVQNYDAIVGDVTIISKRWDYVDFTIPFSEMGIGMIEKKNDDKSMWIFFKPFSADLWITTTCFAILIGFVVWIIERPINEQFQGTFSHQLGIIFWFAFSILVFAQREELKKNISKFVGIVWIFVILILTSSYTATLTSMMTVQQIDKWNSKENNIGFYVDYPFAHSTIVNDLNLEMRKNYSSPEDIADALSKGSQHGGVSAFINEIPYIKIFLAKYPDDYSLVKSMSTTNGFGFVFSKGSPLVDDMSKAIAELREVGKLRHLEEVWFNSKSEFTSQNSTTMDNNVLTFNKFRGLFLISGVSSSLALFLFFIFWLVEKYWPVVREHYYSRFVLSLQGMGIIFHVNQVNPNNVKEIELGGS